MQALKILTSGASTGRRGAAGVGVGATGGQAGAGTDLNSFIGMAMAECAKLFENQSPSIGSGVNRQDAIMKAAAMALRLYRDGQHDAAGSVGGASGIAGVEGGGGGTGNVLMNLAGQYLMG
jgi:hypothetical protein